MSITTARTTVGSVFGMVSAATNAVSSVFDNASAGLSMLDRFVSDAKTRQDMRSVADMRDFRARLLEEKSQEIAERRKTVLEFRNKSPEHAALYDNAYADLDMALSEYEANKKSAAKTNS